MAEKSDYPPANIVVITAGDESFDDFCRDVANNLGQEIVIRPEHALVLFEQIMWDR